MRSKVVVLAAFASLLVTVPAMAADQGPNAQYSDAVAVFFDMDAGTPEVRQNALVRFWNPVRVAGKILMGKYIIEHDTDRMARGEPCTHIYDFYSKKLVASFHCTHLTRPRASGATVSIKPSAEVPAVMTEFQFTGESDAHGVPSR
jgi:hypothetical protein